MKNYKRISNEFDKLLKANNLNVKNMKDLNTFGKASSKYYNSHINSTKYHPFYTFRHYLFILIKIITIILLVTYLIIVSLPDHVKQMAFFNKYKTKIEDYMNIIIGVSLIILFAPIFPQGIYTHIDIMMVFVIGITLVVKNVSDVVNNR
tara:strand:+ start:3000 stop:3446 length:447 start_codon:yes stop_codon:yes gene_type:complete